MPSQALAFSPPASPRPEVVPARGEAGPAIARHLALAMVLSLVLVVGIGGWATVTEFPGR